MNSVTCTQRLLPLFLVVLASFLSVPIRASVEDLTDDQHDVVTKLHDNSFDAHVFSRGGNLHPRSWFIFFYAPWCGHCKTLIPQFKNASRLLEQSGMPHSTFAVVNAVKEKKLASRFSVHEFPTLIYTTGKGKQWHGFHGGHSLDSFVQFAIYLQRAVEAGSFADVVSDPLHFQHVEMQMTDGRVPMFVYVPAKGTKDTGTRPMEERDARWNAAVDAAASLGNIRFGVVYGDDVPENWEEQGSTTYVALIDVAQRCKGTGPDGEVFIVWTDAYKTPQCYEEGSWLTEFTPTTVTEENGKGDALSLQLSPSFEAFIIRHGFRAVEEVTPGFFSVVSGLNHHYLGLIVTDGPLAQTDTTMMPVLRTIVQERNEARAAMNSAGNVSRSDANSLCRISLGHADGRSRSVWRVRYHIEMDELPAFVVVDPRRDKVYRLRRYNPHFEAIKAKLPWRLGGEQQHIIAAFLDDVERGKAPGEKMSLIGDIAEYLLWLPGMEFVYQTLGYEDALFVTMVGAFGFFSFMLFLAIVVEPMMERHTRKHKKIE